VKKNPIDYEFLILIKKSKIEVVFFYFNNFYLIFTINIKSRYKNQENVADFGYILSLSDL